MRGKTIVTLVSCADVYSFKKGDPVECVFGVDGQLLLATRWQTVKLRTVRKFSRLTRWFRPRTVVSAVNVQTGTISMETQRWSWTKWKWL